MAVRRVAAAEHPSAGGAQALWLWVLGQPRSEGVVTWILGGGGTAKAVLDAPLP